jgi:hypothetical protein
MSERAIAGRLGQFRKAALLEAQGFIDRRSTVISKLTFASIGLFVIGAFVGIIGILAAPGENGVVIPNSPPTKKSRR